MEVWPLSWVSDSDQHGGEGQAEFGKRDLVPGLAGAGCQPWGAAGSVTALSPSRGCLESHSDLVPCPGQGSVPGWHWDSKGSRAPGDLVQAENSSGTG